MERWKELARVARLYYVQGMPQREIAARLGTSIATVSRAVARARAAGVVTFQINADREESVHELEAQIEDRFGLNECRIADPQLPLAQGLAVELETALGRLATPGVLVGVSWGNTLKGISELLGQISSNGAEVVPLLGAMGHQDTGVFPNEIARNFARSLGGVNTLVNIPALVDNEEVRAALISDSSFAPIQHLWKRLGIAIFSVSPISEQSSMFTTGLFTARQLEELRATGAVAALNFNFLDELGNPVEADLGRRLVCAPTSVIDNAAHRVMAACGDEKVPALLAALAGNHATILLTDQSTGAALLGANGSN
jgi:deoxyribonucleoside regulator